MEKQIMTQRKIGKAKKFINTRKEKKKENQGKD